MKRKYMLHQESLFYLLGGVATTIVNYVVYFLCKDYLQIHYAISNGLAFLVAVVFAFFVNKYLVFQSTKTGYDSIKHEFVTFFSMRLVSGMVETILLVWLVEWMNMDEGWTKLVVSVLSVVLNYIGSKWFIFQREDNK